MGQTSGAIGGGVAGLAVAGQMAAAQLLAQVLEALHQIAAIEAKAGPVFGHPQALTGTIEVGVQQPQHRGSTPSEEMVKPLGPVLSSI